jgi:hypothetical protein
MAGGEFVHSGIDAAWGWHIGEPQQLIHRCGIELAGKVRVCGKGRELGGEAESAIVKTVVERFFANR